MDDRRRPGRRRRVDQLHVTDVGQFHQGRAVAGSHRLLD